MSVITTVIFVTMERIEHNLFYCCTWEQIFNAILAMTYFIRIVNLCRINIIEVIGFNFLSCLIEFLASEDFPQVL